MEAFSALKEPSYALSSIKIRQHIASLCKNDHDSTVADRFVRSYYLDAQSPFLWIDRYGIDSRADTLVAFLRENVPAIGFAERAFRWESIEEDVEKVRTLSFDNDVNAINTVMARLEYRLTKAYLRYVVGQRFGYVNPLYSFNRLDALDTDTAGRALGYRKLYDVAIECPDNAWYAHAFRCISRDSLGIVLRSAMPVDPMFQHLQKQLAATSNASMRRLLLCNMERQRWRAKAPIDKSGKYVEVNIPAYHLYAHGDSIVDMRIGCGTLKTKTPLLNSEIERMDVNPQWHIPMSIIKNDVVRHAGDPSYFARHRYIIVERATGKQLDGSQVTSAMLLSGKYRVSQEGGEGNALGRIVFRFANNFSVFLHDTSSRGFFSREQRGVSHGCVRVERPFDLAMFLLGERDEWFQDKLRISMGMAPLTEKGKSYVEANPDNFRLVGSQTVKPRVPLAIVYYTYYPDASGQYRQWPDVYGYDEVVWRAIKPFVE